MDSEGTNEGRLVSAIIVAMLDTSVVDFKMVVKDMDVVSVSISRKEKSGSIPPPPDPEPLDAPPQPEAKYPRTM